ncbi:MAG: hypothetical protein HFE78_08470 [Clostridiales bacterium]|nr:hypothetical protein [Clostridiales bacterium]
MKQLMLFLVVLLLFIQNGGGQKFPEVPEPVPSESQEYTESIEETNAFSTEPSESPELAEGEVSPELPGDSPVQIAQPSPSVSSPTEPPVTVPFTEAPSTEAEALTLAPKETEPIEPETSEVGSDKSNSLEIEISVYIDYAIVCGKE